MTHDERAGRAGSAALLALLGGLAVAVPVRAQPVPAPVAGAPAAMAFNIPAGELNGALLAFARQAGVQIAFDPAAVQGVRSSKLAGRYTPQAGLAALLAGTGYGFRFQDARTVMLVPPAPRLAAAAPGAAPVEGAMALPPVDVQATAWRSWQPIRGYVAPVTTTGAKTDTPLIEAPQSVGVVTRDQMDDQAAQTVSQALRYTAGVQPEVRPSPRYDSVFVRGFGGAGTAAAFVNFQDGLRQQRGISYAVPSVDPFLLERIEVLRGPASVLYGQTGAGGLVNLVSKRPTEEPLHEVRIEGGSDGRVQTGIDLGGKLNADGTLFYRFTGLFRDADSQVDYNKERRIAIAPAITYKPDNDTTVTLLASYVNDPYGGYYNYVPAQGTVLYNPNGRLRSNFYSGDPAFNTYKREQTSVGYQLEHRFNDTWTVRQNYRYQNLKSVFEQLSISALSADLKTATRQATLSQENANTSALDNQLQATFNTGPLRHTALFGLAWDYVDAQRNLASTTAGVPTLSLFSPIYNQRITKPGITNAGITNQTQSQLGVYAQDQITWDKLRVNVAVRQDWAESETVLRSTGVATDQNDRKTTWRAGALYLFDSGVAPYVSYSTSFLPNTGTSAPQRGTSPFQPTTGQQYEVGVKYQPPGLNSFVQVSAYQITQQNVLTTDPLYITYSLPTGEIRSRGFEFEGRASLTSKLDLILAYSYIDAEITKTKTAGVSAGNRPAAVPSHIASAWVNYRLPQGPLEGLSMGAGLRYNGSSYGNDTNTFKVPDAFLVDAALRYDTSRFGGFWSGKELTLNVSNLFDKEYISGCASLTTCYFGLRRTVLAGLRVRW